MRPRWLVMIMIMSTSIAATAAVVIMSTSIAATAADDKEVTVDGVILNSENKLVPGVRVSLYAIGVKDPIDSTLTDVNGHYAITRKINSSYDIMYSHSRMTLAIVELLAENKNQSISLKMYPRGAKRPASVYHANLQSAERLQFLILSLKQEDRNKLTDEYISSGMPELTRISSFVDMIEQSSDEIREFLNKRREMVVSTQILLGIK